MNPLSRLLPLLFLALVVTLPQCKSKDDAEETEEAQAEEEGGDEGEDEGDEKAKKKVKKKRNRKPSPEQAKKSREARRKNVNKAERPVDRGTRVQAPSPEAAEPTPYDRDQPDTAPEAAPKKASERASEIAPEPPEPKLVDRKKTKEDEEADKQLPENPNIPAPPTRIPVRKLLSITDLTRTLPERGWVSHGPLPGIQPTKFYNSIIYKKLGTKRFVSLQAWDFEAYPQAVEKWNEALATYPNTQELKELFTELIFFSARNEVISLTLVEPKRSMVLSVACNDEVCNDEAILKLARVVFERARGN